MGAHRDSSTISEGCISHPTSNSEDNGHEQHIFVILILGTILVDQVGTSANTCTVLLVLRLIIGKSRAFGGFSFAVSWISASRKYSTAKAYVGQ